MAYNPFDFFRRNQKILFAVLTVFIMIMFTLSSGAANDFFNWFPRWLGANSSGEVMAVVDGRKVRSSDLFAIRQSRAAANQFMLTAAGAANDKMTKLLADAKGKASEANKPLFDKFGREREAQFPIAGQRWPYLDLMQVVQSGLFQAQLSQDQLRQQLFGMQQQNIAQYRRDLAKVVTANNPKPEDLEAAALARKLLDLDTAPLRQGLYFTDAPNDGDKDALNFLLWKKKADQLGVRFTREDVEALVEEELGRFDKEEQARVLKMTADDRRGQNAASVYGALADEFRVRAAQQAVLGAAVVRAGATPAASPDQAFARFKDLTDPAQWSVVSVRVDQFLPEVKGAPSTNEVTDIFRKGQNTEPDPALSRPALKKPRELKVGWLELTGKEEYYKVAAAKAAEQYDVAYSAAHLLVVPFGGGGFAQVAGVALDAVPDKMVLGEYEKYKAAEVQKAAFGQRPAEAFTSQRTETTDAALSRLEHVGSMFGLAAASPLTAALPAQLRAEQIDLTHRVASQLAPLAPPPLGGASGFGPSLLLHAVTQPEFLSEVAPKPLPVATLRGVMAERVKADFRTSVLPEGDLKKLQADTEKAVADHPNDKTTGRTAAKAVLDKFIADRKLKEANPTQVGESAGFADMHAVGRDPGVERLKDRLKLRFEEFQRNRLLGQEATPPLENPDNFGRVFFKDRPAPGQQRETDSQRFFQPRAYPEAFVGDLSDKSQYMVWLTAEIEAVAPRRADEVRDKIDAEWRRQKARGLAKDAAEKLAAEVAKLKPDSPTVSSGLTGLAQPYGGTTRLPGLAALTIRANDDFGYDLDQYTWPQEFKYRQDKMGQLLVDSRNKPVGTTVVMPDQPESVYYVAVLTGKSEKQPLEFAQAVYAPTAPPQRNPIGQAMPGALANLARGAAMDEAIELLRSEFGYAEENPKVNDKKAAGE